MNDSLTASTTTDDHADATDPAHQADSAELETVLALRSVTKEYPGDPPLRVLHGIDLSIRAGELAAIVGPSGSGKSTLLHIVGTLDRPTSGQVWIAGRDTSTLRDNQLSALRARELGFVFQQFFLLNGVSAVDNVADGLLYTRLPVKKRRQQAIEALEAVGLGHRLEHYPNHLSGGEQQRVAIARALVGRPSLLLADEPTGNLDSRSSESIVDLFHELHDQGATIVVITHDQELAANLPRQVSLRDGRVEHDTTGTGTNGTGEDGGTRGGTATAGPEPGVAPEQDGGAGRAGASPRTDETPGIRL